MGLRLYDTLTRVKVDFVPADPERVTMYVCGPTVYSRAHIGNARAAVVFDVLARLLRHTYGDAHVVYARNITDIDDKIMAAATAEDVDIGTVAARYEAHYLADMGALGVAPPDHAPHATDYIAEMIDMIGELMASGHAYADEGHVLFDTVSAPDYGRLSRRALDEMIAGARVEVAPYKRNPADFILWKPSAAAQAGWDSPWGRGRPGWHIECSAMIKAVLGDTIDIHGGGLDLIFPHHENELAQSSCVNHAPLAQVWMHNGFLSLGGDKMSKSAGKIATVEELLGQGWHPEVLRLALLSAHYRQPLEWTEELLRQTRSRLDRMYQLIGNDAEDSARIPASFITTLADDMNTPAALSWLADSENWVEVCGSVSAPTAAKMGEVKAAGRLLGIFESSYFDWQNFKVQGFAERDSVEFQIAARTAARVARDFATSDRIRDELATQGIILEDSSSGTTWRRA